MNKKLFFEAMNEVDDKFYEEAALFDRKRKNLAWQKWTIAAAACLCLVLGIVFVPKLVTPQPENLPQIESININGMKFAKVAYCFSPDELPTDAIQIDIADSETETDVLYYFSESNPEWVYILEKIDELDIEPEAVSVYVIYIDEETGEVNIRTVGNKLIRYNGRLYVSLDDVHCTLENQHIYEELNEKYDALIEAKSVDGFSFVGNALYTGFGTVPASEFGSNIFQNSEEIYANAEDDSVILVKTTLERPSFGNKMKTYDAFRVYILYDLLENG